MRMSLALLAVVVCTGLVTDAASAATYSAGYCRSRFQSSVGGCYKWFHGDTAVGCATAAYDRFATCMSAGTGTKGTKVQRLQQGNSKPAGANASGIKNVQAVPLTQTNPQYVRPGPNGNPCTVHCGSLGGRRGR